MRRALERLPLRTRLVGLVLVLVAAGLLVSGTTSVAALRGYLVGEVDQRLTDVARGLASTDGSGPFTGPPRTSPVPPRGDADRVYVARYDVSGARLTGRIVDVPDDPPDLPQLTEEQVGAAGEPFYVDSESGATRWRVLLVETPSGYATVAFDLSGIDATVMRLVGIELVVGVIVLLVVAVMGRALVRRSLSDLVAVEHTAAAIAAGDLSQRAPESHPGTEVGSLAASFNTMVANLEGAFDARARSEADAHASAEAARTSEARMRRFIADASHELRTPLTSVRGFAELYRLGALHDDAALSDAMARIEAEAARMGIMVDDLLLLARLDQQRPLARERVELTEIVSDAVAAARVAAPDRTISQHVAGGGRVTMVGDPARLRQVLDNLIGNALRYSEGDQPVEVRLATQPVPIGEPRAVLEVRDRGAGMSADVAARVFERFYRADAARSRADGGSGLGLAIVDAIVRAHGGHVEVATQPGSGTTMRVHLPLNPPPSPGPPLAGPDQPPTLRV